jgi:hypothetical protein
MVVAAQVVAELVVAAAVALVAADPVAVAADAADKRYKAGLNGYGNQAISKIDYFIDTSR